MASETILDSFNQMKTDVSELESLKEMISDASKKGVNVGDITDALQEHIDEINSKVKVLEDEISTKIDTLVDVKNVVENFQKTLIDLPENPSNLERFEQIHLSLQTDKHNLEEIVEKINNWNEDNYVARKCFNLQINDISEKSKEYCDSIKDKLLQLQVSDINSQVESLGKDIANKLSTLVSLERQVSNPDEIQKFRDKIQMDKGTLLSLMNLMNDWNGTHDEVGPEIHEDKSLLSTWEFQVKPSVSGGRIWFNSKENPNLLKLYKDLKPFATKINNEKVQEKQWKYLYAGSSINNMKEYPRKLDSDSSTVLNDKTGWCEVSIACGDLLELKNNKDLFVVVSEKELPIDYLKTVTFMKLY